MIIKGGTSQACAACKHQRRRCSKDCVLAPYFPADQPKMFQNAHRLYGVSNILRVLKKVHPNQKDEAMRSIKYESNMRARFPVYGCLLVIGELERQYNQALEELQYVTAQLPICKDQCYYQMPPPSEIVSIYGQNHHHHPGVATVAPLPPNDFMVNGNNGVGGWFVESNDHDMMKHGYYNNSMPIQSHLMEISHDYDDIPFGAIADDRQSYIGSKDACESSGESTLKDATQSIEHVTKNELRTAVARLSLTGVN